MKPVPDQSPFHSPKSDHLPAQLTLVAPRIPPGQEKSHARRLWLCVHLPRLAVDVLDDDGRTPMTATEMTGSRVLIVACNRAAERHGIHAGMPLAAALPLCTTLRSTPRDAGLECAMLNAFATAACDFSGVVAMYGADGIVLEIGASLKLFGGAKALLRRAQAAFAGLGACFTFAVAGSARAACWLARHRPGTYVLFPEELPGVLRQLPTGVLSTDEKLLHRFERSGIRTLGAVLRLPRNGVARRFGAVILRDIDRALGHEPEPLTLFSPPQSFHAAGELYLPSGDWPRLRPLAEQLLRRLEHYLRRRQAAVQRVQCRLRHAHAPAKVIELNMSRYERRAGPLLALLDRHVERFALEREVTAVEIRCDEIHVVPAANLHLLDGRGAAEQCWPELVDQLKAKLGAERLYVPGVADDHRPERAGAKKMSGLFPHADYGSLSTLEKNKPDTLFAVPLRPAWLLPQPMPLRERDEVPEWNGRLQLSRLPERIEQGWWDGLDVRRDYHLARNPAGSRLWVFRDRRDRGWYLHGIFS